MSKYEQLARQLMEKIRSGIYPANSRLPTTMQLCEEYGVSKITVKQAMDELEAHGLVSRRRGSGVFVKGLEPAVFPIGGTWSPASQMAGFTAERAALGEVVTTELHDFTVVRPPADVAASLRLSPDEFAYHVTRVRFSDGVPLSVEYFYLPIKIAPNLRESHLEGSLYHYVEKDLGLRIGSAHRTVRAVLPTKEEAEWLAVEPSEPLLEITQIRYLDDGRPLECSTARHCGNYALHSISTR